MHGSFRSSQFRSRRDVRFRIIDREAVVLRQEAGETLVLNEVGARTLELLADGGSLEQAVTTMLSEFEVEAEQLERDVSAFVDELVNDGVLEQIAADSTETANTAEKTP